MAEVSVEALSNLKNRYLHPEPLPKLVGTTMEAIWDQFWNDFGAKIDDQSFMDSTQVIYTQSPFLNDITNVLNGFCFRKSFEIQ